MGALRTQIVSLIISALYHPPWYNAEIISGMQIVIWSSDSNCKLRSRCPKGSVTQNKFLFTGFGAVPQQAENAQIRRSGNERFSHMARHTHCLRLLCWTCTPLMNKHSLLAASNAFVDPNAQNLRFRHLRLRWFLMLVGAAPQAPMIAVCPSAAARFTIASIYKLDSPKNNRKYFRIRYWHFFSNLLYSQYTNKLSKMVRDNNFIFFLISFRT